MPLILAETRRTLFVRQQLELFDARQMAQPPRLPLVLDQVLLGDKLHAQSVNFVFHTVPSSLIEAHFTNRCQHVNGLFPTPKTQVFLIVKQIRCSSALRNNTQ